IELVARLKDPHIVTVYHSGVVGGRPYYAMEFIDGLPIDDYVLVNRPTVRDRLKIFEKICRAVAAVHQRGLIHRDLKPGNLLVDLDAQPHILDFGLAKSFMGEDQSLSIAGQMVGTPPFWSPEQARGEEDIDTRSDIYSLGVVLYYILSGTMPYPVQGPAPIVQRNIIEVQPRPLNRLERSEDNEFQSEPIDDELSHVVLKALAKEKERRYQSADAFADDITRYLAGDLVEAKADSALYLFRRAARRYKLHFAIAAGFLVLMTAALVGMTVLWRRSEQMARLTKTAMIMGGYLREAQDLRVAGKPDQGLVMYRKMIEAQQSIADDDPTIQRFLCEAHGGIARSSATLKRDWKTGQDHADEAVRIARKLVRSDPDNVILGVLLVRSVIARAQIASGTENYRDACEILAPELAEVDRLLLIDPKDPDLRFQAEYCRSELADDLRNRDMPDEALPYFLTARSALLRLCHDYPDNMEYILSLEFTEHNSSSTLLDMNDPMCDLAAAEFLAAARNRMERAVAAGIAAPRFFDVNLNIINLDKSMNDYVERDHFMVIDY
ncbi:MAG TPA: serine/threonine-protein kinase, partial [Phycisphaerae bacterium]|nr:serine/threonine-protein kinase [Phycisphaerae bacterium]